MRAHSMGMSGFGPALLRLRQRRLEGSVRHAWACHLCLAAGHKFAEAKRRSFAISAPAENGSLSLREAGFTEATAARHRGCAFGDFDGDGRIDIVATSLDHDAELWMNRSPNAGHWLDIALQRVKSNRDGIGARIKVVTKAGTQYNHQTSSVCYASSSLGPVHFGLGAETKATTVEIHWPSGIVQTLENVPADQTLKVTEPAEPPAAQEIDDHCFGGPAFCCLASSCCTMSRSRLPVVRPMKLVVDRGEFDVRIEPFGIGLLQLFQASPQPLRTCLSCRSALPFAAAPSDSGCSCSASSSIGLAAVQISLLQPHRSEVQIGRKVPGSAFKRRFKCRLRRIRVSQRIASLPGHCVQTRKIRHADRSRHPDRRALRGTPADAIAPCRQ